MTWSMCKEDNFLGDVMLDEKLEKQKEDGMILYSTKVRRDEGEENKRLVY